MATATRKLNNIEQLKKSLTYHFVNNFEGIEGVEILEETELSLVVDIAGMYTFEGHIEPANKYCPFDSLYITQSNTSDDNPIDLSPLINFCVFENIYITYKLDGKTVVSSDIDMDSKGIQTLIIKQ